MLNVRERRSLHAKSEATELIDDYGPSRTEALLNVHRTTVERWRTGAIEPPTAVLLALRAACKGQVPGMELRQWEGWGFGRDGLLWSPNGRSYGPGDLMAQQYERALIRSLQSQVRDLQTRLARATAGGVALAANDGDLTVIQQSDVVM